MKKRCIYVIMVMAALFLARPGSFALAPVNPVSKDTVNPASKAPVNPVSKDAWILNAGFGAAAHYWGNGYGFGPGGKLAFEKGMWKVGPGVFTLGAEIGLSFFWHKWGVNNYNLKERWGNLMLGARSAYHVGFDVPGLDIYGGIPLGIGFSRYTHSGYTGIESWNEWHGYTHHPVFFYVGVFFGASYYFTHSIGINAEFGYNINYVQVGMVFRLK